MKTLPLGVMAAFVVAAGLGVGIALKADEGSPVLGPEFTGAKAAVLFSPKGGATQAIIGEIDGAQKRIAVQAFSFTSVPIISALKRAHERGVVVYVLLDKSNLTGKYSGASYLLNAGVPVGIDPKHAISHSKVMILDPGTPGATVITGSFNFTRAAEESNAENLLILKNCPELVKLYLDNWREHGAHSYEVKREEKAPSPEEKAPEEKASAPDEK